MDCGWPEQWIGIPLLVIPMAGVIGAWAATKIKILFFKAAIVCGIIGGIGTTFAGNSVLEIAVAGAMLGRMCEAFFEILSGEIINKELESDQRATMISVDSMLYSILMIVASPVTGYLGEKFGMEVMFMVFGLCIAAAAIIGCWGYRRWMRSR